MPKSFLANLDARQKKMLVLALPLRSSPVHNPVWDLQSHRVCAKCCMIGKNFVGVFTHISCSSKRLSFNFNCSAQGPRLFKYKDVFTAVQAKRIKIVK